MTSEYAANRRETLKHQGCATFCRIVERSKSLERDPLIHVIQRSYEKLPDGAILDKDKIIENIGNETIHLVFDSCKTETEEEYMDLGRIVECAINDPEVAKCLRKPVRSLLEFRRKHPQIVDCFLSYKGNTIVAA